MRGTSRANAGATPDFHVCARVPGSYGNLAPEGGKYSGDDLLLRGTLQLHADVHLTRRRFFLPAVVLVLADDLRWVRRVADNLPWDATRPNIGDNHALARLFELNPLQARMALAGNRSQVRRQARAFWQSMKTATKPTTCSNSIPVIFEPHPNIRAQTFLDISYYQNLE